MKQTFDGVWLESLFKEVLQMFQGHERMEECLKRGSSSWLPEREGRLLVLSIGKAAISMAKAAMNSNALNAVWQDNWEGWVFTKHGYGVGDDVILLNGKTFLSCEQSHLDPWPIFESGHPIPDQASLAAAHKVRGLVSGLTQNDRLLLLLSGGASAILAAPSEGVCFQEKRSLTEALLKSGADIHQMNCVRKHLSFLKGGGLLRCLSPGRGLTLAISDVSGDAPSSIGSGMSVPDPDTFQEAHEILCRFLGQEQSELQSISSGGKKHLCTEHLWESVKEHFPTCAAHIEKGIQGRVQETPKPEEEVETRMPFEIMSSNGLFLETLRTHAKKMGVETFVFPGFLDRDMEVIVSDLRNELAHWRERSGIKLLCYGGEPTLKVQGKGLGGRMQHVALCMAQHLKGYRDVWLLAGATDGSDGPTEASGAVVSGDTWQKALELGVSGKHALETFDSHAFHKSVKTILYTGPTGTNLCDVVMLLVQGRCRLV